jgi:hypothetical protein
VEQLKWLGAVVYGPVISQKERLLFVVLGSKTKVQPLNAKLQANATNARLIDCSGVTNDAGLN